MKKFTLLLFMLLGVVGVKATPTVTNLETTGGWSYARVGSASMSFTAWGHVDVSQLVSNIDVANYKSVKISYSDATENAFKIVTIGKKAKGTEPEEYDVNHIFESQALTGTEGTVTLTFNSSNYTGNVYQATSTVISSIDLYNETENNASIKVTGVVLVGNDDNETTMGYSSRWSATITNTPELKFRFAQYAEMGHDTWKTELTANTLHRFTVNFAEEVPAGFKFRIYTSEGESYANIAAGSTSASVDIDYAYTNIGLYYDQSGYGNIKISSVTRTVIGTTTTCLWNSEAPGHDLGNWSTNLNLSGNNKPSGISGLQQGDVITVNYTVKEAGTINFQVCNDGYAKLEESSGKYADSQTKDETGELKFAVSDAFAVECAQEKGIIINGANVYINSIYLKHYEDHTALTSVPLTITSNRVATFSSYKNLDFSGLANVTAYYASSVDTENKQVTMKKVTKARAGTGLYIIGDEGSYDIPICGTEGLDEIENNALIAVVTASDVEVSDKDSNGKFNYILAANKTGAANPGFYKVTAKHNLKKHKAYLQTTGDITPTTTEARVALIFDDGEATGVKEVKGLKAETRSEYYDLMGRKVAQPTRGLYIVNGKKVVIK